MPLIPGVCIACGADAWRRATHAKTGEVTPLWPDPLSTYATCSAPSSLAPGLPYCRDCRPILGTALPSPIEVKVGEDTVTLGPIVDVVPAPIRYGAWFETRFREWLVAWAKDHLELSDTDAVPLLAQWDRDARAVQGLFNARPADHSA